MNDNISLIEKNLVASKSFLVNYNVHFEVQGNLVADTATCYFHRSDLVELGRFFGRKGWIRQTSYSGDFDWTKVVDGITIHVYDAEENTLDKSPVPEKAFPLQIEDSTIAATPKDEIPF